MNLCRHCGQWIERDWANDVTVLRGNKAETTECWVSAGDAYCEDYRRHEPLVVAMEDVVTGLRAMQADLK